MRFLMLLTLLIPVASAAVTLQGVSVSGVTLDVVDAPAAPPAPTPVTVVRTANIQAFTDATITQSIDATGADGVVATIAVDLGVAFSGATCGGTPMVFISSSTGENALTAMYRMAAPGSGSQEVIVTLNTATDGAILHLFAVTGMSQTDPVVAVAEGSSIASPYSLSVTGEADGLIIDVMALPYYLETFSAAVGQTAVTPDATFGGSSYKTAAAGANTMTWMDSGGGASGTAGHIAVSLRGQ